MRDLYLLLWLFPKNRRLVQDLKLYSNSEQEPSDFIKYVFIKSKNKVKELKNLLKANSIKFITVKEDLYPEILNEDPYAPMIFSYIGDFESYLKSNPVALVGSRKIDCRLNQWIQMSFKKKYSKYIYVSGGAIGVDQAVHRSCIESKNMTLVVLPSGLLNLYPKSISSLKNLDNVIFISQFSPYQKLYKSNFYERNHFMASLSKAVVVLQAAKRSGTLITARYALELNKDIYVLSCSPWDERYSGNTKLLSEGANQIINLDLFQ